MCYMYKGFPINIIRIYFVTALKSADEVYLKRARHVITEIYRTFIAADALTKGDFIKVINKSAKSYT